jgi:chlorophyll/bacteriochlorophyll a synthase
MKPITWFPPMWAFLCGTIASGASAWALPDVGRIALGVVMAGPVLCGLSQVINDYFDRHVDAINEPNRPIPSGQVKLWQVGVQAALLTLIGTALALYLGVNVFVYAGIGFVLAVAYSAPPIRTKRNGWVGNTTVAISYEGLAWLAGHAAFASLTGPSVLIAMLYAFGSHGIMSINDYKSITGDVASGIKTIPVLLGTQKAAWLIVGTMNVAQILIIAAFLVWGRWVFAAILLGVLLVQVPTQISFIKQPTENYLKFSAIGVSLFVWGMPIAAIGLRAL